ncbi:MAG: hypothetical protein JWN13_1574 [Betaproteobacteria bacterium]|nr:hypothetical protein [Betaproteobacteria bacterium]
MHTCSPGWVETFRSSPWTRIAFDLLWVNGADFRTLLQIGCARATVANPHGARTRCEAVGFTRAAGRIDDDNQP